MTEKPATPRWIKANGLDFAYFEQGEGPLVLCLHGFPDTAWGFVPVLDRLAAAGFRAVAPFMRGYAPTSLAPDGDYSLDALARDIIALIEHFGADKAYVVGHDWGSAATQFAANLRPDRIEKIVLCSVPHLRRFFLGARPAQLKRSHYMFRFQWPGWAEKTLPQNDFAWMVDVLIRRWSPGWKFTEEDLAPLKAGFSDPQRLKAALAYYRALPRSLVNPAQLRVAFARTTVPARVIYGTDDGCIGPEMFRGQDKLFSAGLELCEAPGLGHFMQWENPGWFADRLIEFFKPRDK